MRKDKKLQVFVLIPVVIGLALIIASIVSGNGTIMYVGIATLFGGSFLVAIITTLVVIIGVARGDKTDNGSRSTHDKKASDASGTLSDDDRIDAREKEYESLANINSTYGYDNKLAQAEHQISHIKKAFKASNGSERAKGCTFAFFFVGSFLGCAIGGMVLLSMDHTVPGILVFLCSFLIIIGALVVVKIKEHLSMSTKYKPEDYTRKTGRVTLCVMSSSTVAGEHNARVTSMTYRVGLEIEGKTYNAYSSNYYNEGEVLPVLLHKKGKIVKILDKEFMSANNIDDDDDYIDDDDYVDGGDPFEPRTTKPASSEKSTTSDDIDKKSFSEVDDMMSDAEDMLFAALEKCDRETYDMIYEAWCADIDRYGDGLTPKEVFTGHYKTAVKYGKLLDALGDGSKDMRITREQLDEFLAKYDDDKSDAPSASDEQKPSPTVKAKTQKKRSSADGVEKKPTASKAEPVVADEQLPESHVEPTRPFADETPVPPIAPVEHDDAVAETPVTPIAEQEPPAADKPTLGYKGIKGKK